MENRVRRTKKRGFLAAVKRHSSAIIILCVAAAILVSVLSLTGAGGTVTTFADIYYKKIVVDPGHGGFDPGANGVTEVSEASINLSISKKLAKQLQLTGANVIMTRETDKALGGSKPEDMATRRKLILETSPDIFISIHQNKFSDTSCVGPQVFYDPKSEQGKILAVYVQDALNATLKITNPRVAKAETHYITSSGNTPGIIIECGFLSNAEEEVLLQNDKYQTEIVRGICAGLEEYFRDTDSRKSA